MNRRNFLKIFSLAVTALGLGVRRAASAPELPYPVPTSALTPTMIRKAWQASGRPLPSRGHIHVLTCGSTGDYLRYRFPGELAGISFSWLVFPRRFDVINNRRRELFPASPSSPYWIAPFQDHILMDGNVPVCVISSRRHDLPAYQ